ncbi:MAG: hypothetical protein SAJ11_22505, partial [Jaaginema sp. PMC 1078.18]|nr:hypothetical protein [Jaaginema sp. PMC 1078.18]
GLIGILNHAMWRDEMTIWLIVRDSQSWGELLQIIHYEPHPVLWYFCVAILQKFIGYPVSMQLFHLLLGTGVAALILIKSPFTRWQKVVLIFGYLFFYEYFLISRNYSLGLLFGFGVCALWETRKHTYIKLAFLLFFMANSSAYSLFIAIALGFTLILENLLQNSWHYHTKASLKNYCLSLIIFLSGIGLAIAFLIPPADNIENGGFSQGWRLTFELRHFFTTLARLWNSYIAIIVAGDSKYYSVLICGTLSLVLMLWVIGFLLKKPLVLFFYLIATTEIFLFTYVKYLGAQRHFGHLFIVLIMALWLSHYYRDWPLILKQTKFSRKWFNFSNRSKKALVMVLLYLQLIAGIVAYSRDLMLPFSASRATAEYISQQGLNDLFIVGSQDVIMSPISGYLRRKIYYPESQALGSFVLFTNRRQEVNPEEVLRQVGELLKIHDSILLILNYPLELSPTNLKIEFLAKFQKGLIYDEKYHLYRVESSDTLTK